MVYVSAVPVPAGPGRTLSFFRDPINISMYSAGSIKGLWGPITPIVFARTVVGCIQPTSSVNCHASARFLLCACGAGRSDLMCIGLPNLESSIVSVVPFKRLSRRLFLIVSTELMCLLLRQA